jgi:hypothetical protein
MRTSEVIQGMGGCQLLEITKIAEVVNWCPETAD